VQRSRKGYEEIMEPLVLKTFFERLKPSKICSLGLGLIVIVGCILTSKRLFELM